MSESKFLPIDYLSPRVAEVFNKLVSLDIEGEIGKGLDPIIHYIDDIYNIAGIAGSSVSSNNASVYISKPYCQMLWILCNIALRVYDSASVCEAVERMTEEDKRKFYEELKIDCPSTRYIKEVINWEDTLMTVAELGEVIKRLLKNNITYEELRRCKHISDIESEIAIKANSLYCYGVAFILAHEFSHYSLGHNLNTDGSADEERAADHHAFWSMAADLDGKERETAMMGVICALSSLLFTNPKLEQDGIHPQENERIFEFYDIVIKDNQDLKYMQMLIMILTTWAVCCEINDFPKVSELKASEECLREMRDYLSHIANSAPVSLSTAYKTFSICALSSGYQTINSYE